jgi:hypothetical protein
MKIIKQTPTKLVLLYFPLGIWFLVLGFIILPFGLVLNLHKATDRFTCHRIAPSQGTCTLRKLRFWFGPPIKEEIPLSKLQKVQFSKITGVVIILNTLFLSINKAAFYRWEVRDNTERI